MKRSVDFAYSRAKPGADISLKLFCRNIFRIITESCGTSSMTHFFIRSYAPLSDRQIEYACPHYQRNSEIA